MEDPASTSTNTMPEPAASRTRGLAHTVAEQRRQIEEFLASQRDRMDDVEVQVTESLGRIIDELIHERAETDGNQRDLENRAAQLEQESQRTAQMRAELDAARADWEQKQRSAEEQQAMFLEQLRREFGQQPKGGGGGDSEDGDSEDGEYQQRYKMALEDIRELREKNETLKKGLDEVRACEKSGRETAQTAASLSWEAQKRQILASLDKGFDENNPEDVKERAQIEEVIKATDLAIAQKAEEIKDLNQLLKSQNRNIGTVAVGAAAVGEIIDNDQIVQNERESLKQLQEEMHEKLRAAEIYISVERAKVARERADLDENLRLLAHRQPGDKASEADGTAEQEKPSRGRWLSRLGLNDLDN